MSGITNVELPEIFPAEDIVVKEEEHRYDVYQGDDGPLPKNEYTLNKAPIQNIRKVTGTLNGGSEYEFVKGVDYELSSDDERIVWLSGDKPDSGTLFYVTYLSESVMGRYIASGDEELDTVEHELEDTIASKFIDTAEGSELDRIGDLFGPVIGSRSGRDDERYRTYLKSVVQSFNSRGRIVDIKEAIVSSLGLRELDVDLVDEDPTVNEGDDGYHLQKVGIDENFTDTSYTVIIPTGATHSVQLIEDIADIADASGVDHARTSYVIPDDVMKIADDATAVTANTEVADTMVAEESVLPNITLTDIQNEAVSSDIVLDRVSETITPRKTWDTNSYDTVNWEETEDSEIEQSDDEVIANIEFTDPLAEDTSISADSVLVDFFDIQWNVADWGGDGGWV